MTTNILCLNKVNKYIMCNMKFTLVSQIVAKSMKRGLAYTTPHHLFCYTTYLGESCS